MGLAELLPRNETPSLFHNGTPFHEGLDFGEFKLGFSFGLILNRQLAVPLDLTAYCLLLK